MEDFQIVDLEHWKIMQLDPNKIYKISSRFKVWQMGKGIMKDYLLNKELENKFWLKMLWGK